MAANELLLGDDMARRTARKRVSRVDVLEGVDETTARQRARQEMDSDLRKDRRR
jgi:hypothetical protein